MACRRQGGDVFEHGLAAVAKARGLDGGALQGAAELVHHESGESFAFNILSDDQRACPSWAVCSSNGSRSFIELIFFSWMRMRASSDAFHAFGVGDEVGER